MSTSTISGTASVSPDATIGAYCVIEDGVVIGSGCVIGHHVVIRSGTTIGKNVRVDDHTTLGKLPMRSPNSAVTREQELPPARVDDDCLIGAGVVIYAGCHLGRKVLVADLATIRENVTVGECTIVGRGVAIENKCTVGRYCKLETNAYITAYSEVGDRVFVAPGVLTSNDNFMGRTEERFKHFRGVSVARGGRLGVGCVILPGVRIGEDGVVAAGAVQTQNAEPNTIYAGVPARRFRDVPEEQKLDNQGWED